MFTPVSYANMPFWNILPMGMTNYGGDIQIFNVDEYANKRINMTLNIPAQIQFCQAAAMDCGGFGGSPQINMDTVKALSEAMYNAGMSYVNQYGNQEQGTSSLDSKLKALNENKYLSDEDKKKVAEAIQEIEKIEKEIEELKNAENLSDEERQAKTTDLQKRLRDILTTTNEIADRVNEAEKQAEQASKKENS